MYLDLKILIQQNEELNWTKSISSYPDRWINVPHELTIKCTINATNKYSVCFKTMTLTKPAVYQVKTKIYNKQHFKNTFSGLPSELFINIYHIYDFATNITFQKISSHCDLIC